MQNKFSNLKVRRDAKFTMLKKHWENTLAWLDQKGTETGNQEIKMVSTRILMVDTKIKEFVLRQLLFQIQKLNAISFYKMRATSKTAVCNIVQLQELISKR